MIEAPARSTDHRLTWLIRRWPTLLAVGLAAVIGIGLTDPLDLSFLLIILVLGYMVPLLLGRSDAAWWVALSATALVTIARILEVDETVLLLVVAAIVIAVGAVQRPAGFGVQAAGGLALVATALVASVMNPTIGGALIATGLFGHAAWDVYHHQADKVVARSYAEWCAVLDTLLGVAVIAALL